MQEPVICNIDKLLNIFQINSTISIREGQGGNMNKCMIPDTPAAGIWVELCSRLQYEWSKDAFAATQILYLKSDLDITNHLYAFTIVA